jgi:hypothetical protein
MNKVRIAGSLENTDDDFFVTINTEKGEVIGRLLKFEHIEDNTLVEAIGYLKRNVIDGNIFYIEELKKI